MNNQAISKVELQKLIDTKNSFVDLSVKYSLGINTDEFAKFPSFFDQRLTENQEQISSLGNELESVQQELTQTQTDLSDANENLQAKTYELEQKQIELNNKIIELQEAQNALSSKTEEFEQYTTTVNTIKYSIKDVVTEIDSSLITNETPFENYPNQIANAIDTANRQGYNTGVTDENTRWTTLVNSATATADDVLKGKTFVDKYGEIKDGTLDNSDLEKQVLKEMWDNIQQFGARTDYNYFGQVIWTKKNFKPTYDFRPANAYLLFSNGTAKHREQRAKDGMIIMKELEEEMGIVFDFSNCTLFHDAFQNSPFIELNVIDVSRATNLSFTFYGGASGGAISQFLRRIERLICSATTPFVNSTFGYASEFTYIGFEGVIAQNGLNLQWSTKLNKESITKLVNTLSATTSGLSVALSRTAVENAFAGGVENDEWLNLIATKSNWTISLV